MKTLLVVLAVLLPATAAAENFGGYAANLPEQRFGIFLGTSPIHLRFGGFMEAKGGAFGESHGDWGSFNVAVTFPHRSPIKAYWGLGATIEFPEGSAISGNMLGGVLVEVPGGLVLRIGGETRPKGISVGIGYWR